MTEKGQRWENRRNKAGFFLLYINDYICYDDDSYSIGISNKI